MDVRQLQVLRELGELGSVRAVADALRITPSAVSQQLRLLQAPVRVPLTRREGRILRLTEAGEALAAAAVDVETALARARQLAEELQQAPRGTVSVSAFNSAATAFFPALARGFPASAAVRVVLTDEDVEQRAFAPLTASYDIVVAHRFEHTAAWPSTVTAVLLLTEPLDVALPVDHPLARRRTITARAATSEPWITTHAGFPVGAIIDTLATVTGRPVTVAHRVNEFTVAAELVRAGAGLALIPRWTTPAPAGVVLRPLADVRSSRRIDALARPENLTRAAVGAVLAALRQAGQRLASGQRGLSPWCWAMGGALCNNPLSEWPAQSIATPSGVWQSAVVSSAKHPNRRRWPAAARHPAWRAGAVAMALILLPWIPALARPHHHLDVATVTVLVSLSLGLPMIWLTWALYRDARSATLVSSLSVAQVADQLAVAVSAQWQAEASMRRLNDPYPLPVAWAAADASLADSWDSLVRLAASGAGWPPPPPAGTWAAGPEDLAGAGGDLVEALAQVPTHRLVVLGEPGTGKTMLMVRLVLDLLARRAPGGPVPFLASVASWNPAEQDLRSWLCAQLLTNHPALSALPATRDEPTQAAELLAAGLLLPILDGLDEIREEVRGSAVSRISDALRPGEYLVVTCRSDQYRDAVRPTNGIEVTLRGAAAVQLGPLDADAVSKYLREDAGGPDARVRWDPVLPVLGTEAPAAQALATPLMVSLARTIYNPRPGELIRGLREPKELCNSTLTDRTAVESLLLDAFIPASYRHEPTDQAQEAEKWLVFLARYLERKIGSPDLAWWQLPQAVPRFLPEAVTLAGASLFIGALAGVVAGIRLGVAFGTLAAVTFGTYTATLGMGKILVEDGKPPKPSRGISFRPPSAGVVGVGILIGIIIGGATAAARGAVAGVVTGVGVGVVTGFAGWSSSLKAAPLDISSAVSPPVVLARDRKAAIVAAALAGAGFGAAAGLLVGEWAGVVAGVVTGVAVGVVAGIYNSFTAAWPFYKIAQILLVLRGRLPWPLMSFLADAHRRGVLRQVGANYQFRHFELQHRLATRLAIWPSDRYTKAIEQLGSDKTRKRIRAIHILKRAARRSAADHPTVMDVLSTFICEHKGEPQPSEPVIAAPERDVQAALTVIGRRNYRYDQRTINLSGAELSFVRIWDAHLVNADLNGADLTHADLTNTNLSGANLTNANLTRAKLGGTKLSGADLSCANLTRAKLQHATLRGALLTDGNLTRANLSSAHLDGANLTRVDLSFATLTDADLTDADLSGANLSYVALNGADLSGALWPLAEAVPWGWQRDTDSGRLKRARLSARLRRHS